MNRGKVIIRRGRWKWVTLSEGTLSTNVRHVHVPLNDNIDVFWYENAVLYVSLPLFSYRYRSATNMIRTLFITGLRYGISNKQLAGLSIYN